jgi:hypothetical protein
VQWRYSTASETHGQNEADFTKVKHQIPKATRPQRRIASGLISQFLSFT